MYSGSMFTPSPGPMGTLTVPSMLSKGSALLTTGTTVPLASASIEHFELVVFGGGGAGGDHLQHVNVSETSTRNVRSDLKFCNFCHTSNLHSGNHTSIIEKVGLHDLKDFLADQIAERMYAKFLFTTGRRNVESELNQLLLFIPIPRNRLLIEVVVVLFENLANANGFLDVLGPIAVDH